MNYTANQVVNGLIQYADGEIMPKLPTTARWIMGTGLVLASNKINRMVDVLVNNALVKMLGVVDDDKNVNVDELIAAMQSSADRYGNLMLDIPMVGKLSFSPSDIERLRTYIV